MKKIILSSIIFGVTSLIFANSTAYAATVETQENITEEYVEIVPNLSDQDFNQAFEKLGDTSNLSESERNTLAMEVLIETHEENSKQRYGYGGFQMNKAEDNLFKSNPFEGISYARAAIKSQEKTIELFKVNGADDASDAFRHSYWNAVLTVYIGATRAKIWTDAHESTSSGLPKQMDLYNNNVGRALAKGYTTVNNSLSSKVYSAVKDGKMKVIKNNKLVNSKI